MTRRRAIAAAIIRRTQMRSPFEHLARNPDAGLAGVVALVFAAAAWIFRNAARLRRVGIVPGRVPVAGPLPDIADHVVKAVAVRRKGFYRRGAVVTVEMKVMQREIALPGVGHLSAAGPEFIAPGQLGAIEAAARGELPLRFGRQ